MKKLIVCLTIVTVSIVTAFNININSKKNLKNILSSTNIEALASNESGGGELKVKTIVDYEKTESEYFCWGGQDLKETYKIKERDCIGTGYLSCTPEYSETLISSEYVDCTHK